MIWSSWCYLWCFIAITCYAESTEDETQSGDKFEILSSFQKTVEDMKIELKELQKVNAEFREENKNLKLEKESRQLQFENKMLEANTELIKLIKEQRTVYEENSKCNLFLSNCMAQTSKANEKNQENANTQFIITSVDKILKEFQLRHWMTYDRKVINYDFNKALLEMSSYWSNTPIASVLISLGADVNTTDKDRNTPIINAAHCHTPFSNSIINTGYEMSKLLLKHGANINAQNKDGITALMKAIICPRLDTNVIDHVQLLLEHGADANIGDTEKSTALMMAIEKGYLEIVKILLDNKADINLVRLDKSNALFIAAERGRAEILKLLLTHGAHVDDRKNGDTALIMACKNNNPPIAMVLLEVTQDLNIQNNEGKTALMYAVLSKREELVMKLVDLGANIYIKDKQGKAVTDRQSYFYNYGNMYEYNVRNIYNYISKFTTTPMPSTTVIG